MNKQALIVVLGLSLAVAPVCLAHEAKTTQEPVAQVATPEAIAPEVSAPVAPEATPTPAVDATAQQPGEEELQALFKQILDELEQEQQKEKAKENKTKEAEAAVVA